MSELGFSSGNGVGSRSTAMVGGSTEGLDKIDMSLDDIIRLNRKEQKTRKPSAGTLKLQANGRLPQGDPAKGGGAARLGVRGRKVPLAVGRRRGQGVITGLAARRTATLRKGVGPMNRNTLTQKSRVLLQRRAASFRQTELQRQPFRRQDAQRGFVAAGAAAASRRPAQIRRRTAVSVPQAQKAARQATFLFHRGLKVHTQVQNPVTVPAAPRTRPWRTSTASSGILTVSIENPCARTQPEPPRAWSLHPPAPSPPSLKEDDEMEEDRKPPKGVQLQFDINSVGKQTAMTLNERFRILKDRRAATSVQPGRGSRFVTVG
ncbi:UAP56-interacting factor-like isoform X2 [Scleropages formosus]|uniref:UAP56-interacting factor-like isoform X2 n=1 Tax=Scleropages formosus TaxID=113540 RepID=UPI00087822AC|nr:UAP56-interacting factor-like isoform X2 [Scleropages formosus]